MNCVVFIFQGQATDIQIQAEEIIKLKKQINGLYFKHTNKPLADIGKFFVCYTDNICVLLENIKYICMS